MNCLNVKSLTQALVAGVLFWGGILPSAPAEGSAVPESGAEGAKGGRETLVDLHYSPASGKEPSADPKLGFSASKTGEGTVRQGVLRTTDADAQSDGRYYTLPAGALQIDSSSDVELKFVVRVIRSSGSRTATTIELPLASGNPRLGPFHTGGHGEGYQDVLFDGCQLAIGLISDGEHHERDEIQLIDSSRSGAEWIVGRIQIPLNESRQYTLAVHREGPGADDDMIILSPDAKGVESLRVPLKEFQTQSGSSSFSLNVGHPAGPGVAEAEWRELSLVVTRPTTGVQVSSQPKTVHALDQHRQLLIDDFLIDTLKEVTRVQGTPVKAPRNPVLKRERPWEAARCELYGSAFWNPEKQQLEMFYSASKVPYDAKLSLAISKDKGETWTRPELDVFPYEGKPSNIVRPGRYWTHGPCVLFDSHDSDASRRYKLFLTAAPLAPVEANKETDGQRGIDVAFSPDGIHWTSQPGNPVIPGFNSDTGNSVIWDEAKKMYRAFIRVRCNVGRSVGITESTDFVKWSEPRTIYTPTLFDSKHKREYYGLSVTPYEGLYLGLVWIFPNTPESANMTLETPTTWVELVVSRDGEHWDRPFIGQQFIPLGEKGEFDRRQLRPASSMAVLDDRIVMMYSGSPHAHVAGHNWDIGMAKLRLDGFAALEASDKEGSILTRPLTFEAGKLAVNADVGNGGFVKAELIDEAGKVVEGYSAGESLSVTGDHLHAPLAWKSQAVLPASGSSGMRLRFVLRNARIYSFQIAP